MRVHRNATGLRADRDGPSGVGGTRIALLGAFTLLAVCVLCGALAASAATEAVAGEGPLEVTLEGAILLALRNNRALSVERITPAVLGTYEEEEKSVFDAAFSAGISSSRERSPAGAENAGEDAESSRGQFEAGISKRLPAGTEVSLGLTAGRRRSDPYGGQYSSRLGLSATQALLRGAGLDVNLASVRRAGIDTAVSEYELRGFTENLVAEVERTYWNYALALRQAEIYRQSLELAGQQLTETEDRVRVGKLAEIEIAAARAELALRQEALINAFSHGETIRLRLIRLLNPPGEDAWGREIILKDLPDAPDLELDEAASHAELALRMRPDINQARLGMRLRELELVKTKNGLLPRMDFFISLGKTGYSDSFSGSVRDLDGKGYDVSAGLVFEFPLGNRAADSRHERALLTGGRAEEALGNLAQLAEMDVRLAYLEVERTYRQIEATAATRKFQEEKVRAETEKFRLGDSTALLVAQAQRDLVDSRISEERAVVNYLNSLVELFRAEGSLLERRGVAVGSV